MAISRAIVREAKGFLFDEPLSNLDAALRVEMRFEIAKLNDTLNTTMVYVTHDQVEAMTLADRIVVLKDGRIMQVGTPRQLYERPENLFVAQFIGSPKMNVLPCVTKAGTIHLRGHEAGNFKRHAGEKKVVNLGVRPEHISIAGKDKAYCTGKVEVAEYLGTDTYLHVGCENLGTLVVRSKGSEPDRKGQTVGLRFDEDHIHFFAEDNQAVHLQPGS